MSWGRRGGSAGPGGEPTVTHPPTLHPCLAVDGHSSSEDASACMHLVIWKIREDAKTKR